MATIPTYAQPSQGWLTPCMNLSFSRFNGPPMGRNTEPGVAWYSVNPQGFVVLPICVSVSFTNRLKNQHGYQRSSQQFQVSGKGRPLPARIASHEDGGARIGKDQNRSDHAQVGMGEEEEQQGQDETNDVSAGRRFLIQEQEVQGGGG